MPPNPALTFNHNNVQYTIFRGNTPVMPGEIHPDKKYLLIIANGICTISDVEDDEVKAAEEEQLTTDEEQLTTDNAVNL